MDARSHKTCPPQVRDTKNAHKLTLHRPLAATGEHFCKVKYEDDRAFHELFWTAFLKRRSHHSTLLTTEDLNGMRFEIEPGVAVDMNDLDWWATPFFRSCPCVEYRLGASHFTKTPWIWHLGVF